MELTVVWLEQALHREPDRLNRLLKEEIEKIENAREDIDAILVGYGLCSGGVVGVKSDKYKIVVPRAHDCITLFLGSKERYLDEFSKAPGTYWYTPGFISGKFQPGMSEKYGGVYHEFEENYEKYLQKFGDPELAKYIIDSQEQAWIKNYSRGVFVNSGLRGGTALKKKSIEFCKERGWTFEEVKGDFNLLTDLVSGKWDAGRFLIIDPGETLVIGGVAEIISTDKVEKETFATGEDYKESHYYNHGYEINKTDSPVILDSSMDIVIGIDAGGTFTDAVVISLKDKKVLAGAKSPTTYHDLSVGVRNALIKLPPKLLKLSTRLAISTTLATNAIVEEKGSRTGLILIGYDDYTYTNATIGSGDIKETVKGLHNIYGMEVEPLDENGLIETAGSMIARGVEAIAISSYMGTRNPDHEIRAQKILREKFGIPVVSGHGLTNDLDSIRRANTVLLNARLLPVIDRLVSSIENVAQELGLADDIRIVTTDGSLMNTNEARETPVRMVLSGPAASVMGVRFLTDVKSCVLVDIGGTTTDIAVIEGGSARRTGRGAMVGKYKTSITATDIRTVGLGGDSCVKWINNHLVVGPQRALPISVLCAGHPEINDRLKELAGFKGSDYGLVQPATFYSLVRNPGNLSFLNSREQLVIRFLQKGPLPEVDLAESLNYPYYSLLGLERLEELGIIIRSGLTPTDIMIHEGIFNGGDPEAANILLKIYSQSSGIPVTEFVSIAWNEIYKLSVSAILTEVLSSNRADESFPGCHYCEKLFEQNSPVDISYNLKTDIVGVGAPSQDMLTGIERFLKSKKQFPKWGEVANAVGAASGAGGMHIDMQIMAEGKGRYVLYSPSGMFIFSTLDEAKSESIELAKENAENYALKMGYSRFMLDIKIHDRIAPTSFENDVYIDTTVVTSLKY